MAGNTSGKTNQNKKPVKKKGKKAVSSEKQIRILIFFILALFMGSIVLINAGGVWGHLRNFLFGVFGFAAFLVPLFIIFLCVTAALGKDTRRFHGCVIEGVILFILLMSFIFIVQSDITLTYGGQIKAAYQVFRSFDGSGMRYGTGVLGAVFGGLPLLLTAANKLAAGIITVLLFFACGMLFSGTTLIKLIHSLRTPAEAVGEYAEEKIVDFKETYETVATDRQEKKARDQKRRQEKAERLERERKEKEAAELNSQENSSDDDKALGIPDEVPPVPLDSIFAEAQREHDEKIETLKQRRTRFADETEADADIDNIEEPATFEEQFSAHTTKSEEKLQNLVEEADPDGVDEDIAETAVNSDETEPEKREYVLPPIDCLNPPKSTGEGDHADELRKNADKIVKTLSSFGVGTRIVDICRSPSVTRYELQPDPGVKISRITSLSDDIAMNLAASGVRIEAPIPNKNAVGIEVPNAEKTSVTLREIIDSSAFKSAKSKLNVALGRNIQGEPTCADLAKMPHLLVAGTTGSGKSVCLNAMIMSLLYNANPDEVKLIMIDPKKVEFTVYRSLPHLLVPVVADPRKAAGALSWAVAEMDKRYALFAEKGVRNLQGYNNYAAMENLPNMPQIVIIIDELSDLMMAASNEVEDSICRLAQKARAAGMHLIVATQRPSVDVITGLIKANIPSRIAFAVKSQIDSRTIIDTQGAEKLLGYGDMLYCPVGLSKPLRVQGAYVSDDEIEKVIKFVTEQGNAHYDDAVMQEIELHAAKEDKKKGSAVSADVGSGDDADEMLPKAIETVVETGMASTTLLQRKLKLGYARAARIVDELAERGIVGPYEGSKPRKVLITKDQWYEMQANSQSFKPKQLTIEDVSAESHEEHHEQENEPSEHNYFGGAVRSDYDMNGESDE